MTGGRSPRCGLLFVLALALATWGVRLALPDDLSKRDQERPVSYVADVLLNGHWLVQHDHHANVASKPPLYTWVAAVVSIATSSFSRPVWTSPAALAFTATALAIFLFGERRIGPGAGLVAAAFFIFSPLGSRSSTLVRSDTPFCALVFLAAWAGLEARERGRSFTPFWLLSAAATLAKGPLGLLLAALGPLTAGRAVPRGPGVLRAHLPGALAYLAICGGWLAAAMAADGPAVYERLIGRELLGHAVLGDGGEAPFSRAYMPPFYLLTRFAPWSLLAAVSVFVGARAGVATARERRTDRFLLGLLFGGLILFGAAGHQRQTLVLPLLPVASLLAGRLVARWLGFSRRPIRSVVVAALLATTCLPLLAWYHARVEVEDPEILRGRMSRNLAAVVESRAGRSTPIAFNDVKAVQNYLGVHRREIGHEAACQLLAGEGSALVATSRTVELLKACRERGVNAFVLWDAGKTGRADERLALVGNRPRGAAAVPRRGYAAPLILEWSGLIPTGLTSAHDEWPRLRTSAEFEVTAPDPLLSVENLAARPVTLDLRLQRGSEGWNERHEIAAHATTDIRIDGRAGRPLQGGSGAGVTAPRVQREVSQLD